MAAIVVAFSSSSLTAGAQAAPSSAASTKVTDEGGDETLTLPAFTVIENAQEGYLGTNSLSATAAAIPVTDLPFSLTVLTRNVIDDSGAYQLLDLSKFVSGMQSYNRPYSDVAGQLLRGFSSSVATDGHQTMSEVTRDTATIERVEVLKGPSALLFPRGGSAGGVINVVTKNPFGQQAGYLKVQAGQYNANRVELDYNGTPAVNGKLFYRVIAAVQDSDGYSETDYTKRFIFFPAITYKFSATADLTVKYQRWDQTSTTPTGQGLGPKGEADLAHPYFDYSLPRSRSFDDPDLNKNTKKEDRFWVTLNSQLNDSVALHTGLEGTITDDDRKFTRPRVVGTAPLIAANGTVERIFDDPHWKTHQYRAFLDTVTVATLWNSKHTLVIGGEFMYEAQDISNLPSFPNFAPTNAFAPPVGGNVNPWPVVPFIPNFLNNNTKAYIMDIAKFWGDRIIVNVGESRTWTVQQSWSAASSAYTQVPNPVQNVKQYGLMLQPVEGYIVYASYNENYNPSNSTLGVINPDGTVTAGPRAPSQFNISKEAGAKLRVMGGRLSFNVAVYEISLTNRTQGILGTYYSEFLGDGTSKGVEGDIFYAPNDNLSAILTFSHGQTRNVGNGLRFTDVPTNIGSGWLRYDVRNGALKGLGVGGGFTYCDSMENISRGVRFTYPGRTVCDLALFYSRPTWKAQVNVANVFDADYYAGGSPPTISFRGAPRNVQGSVTYSF